MAARPSAAETASLVKALGRYVGAGRHSPGVRVEQRLYNIYRRTLTRLQRKYPAVDLESSEFNDQLRTRATQWWDSREIRGSGTDW